MAMKLKEIFEKGIVKMLNNYSSDLGNRTEYIGASDVAQCPKKVVMSKLNPIKNGERSKEEILRLIRGHVAEIILAGALKAENIKFKTQKEYVHPEYPFIKVHPDIVFEANDVIGVVEQKSTDGIPSEPYDSWLYQLNFQMGVIKSNFPDKTVKGVLAPIDLNKGDYAFFNGYEYDENIFNVLMDKALQLWQYIQDKDIESPETEVSPLCKFCPFKAACPEFNGDEDNVPDMLTDLIEEYKHNLEIENRYAKEKSKIQKDIIQLVGESYTAKTNGYKLVVKPVESEFLSGKDLKEKYPEEYERILSYPGVKKVRKYTFFRVYG